MSFGQAVSTCLRQYVVVEGRARRSEFWYFYLFYVIVASVATAALVIVLLPEILSLAEAIERTGRFDLQAFDLRTIVVAALVVNAVLLVVAIPLYAAQARRLHDMGQSGLWVLANFVGLSIVPLIMCILEGERGTNQWGLDPRAEVPPGPPSV